MHYLYLLFYRLFILSYKTGIQVVSPWNKKASYWVKGRKDIYENLLHNLKEADPAKERLWMHCASLGEFEQGRPVLEDIKAVYPDVLIYLSFFSSSGFEATKNFKGA